MKPVFAVPILLLTIGISPAVAQAQTVGVLQNNTARTSPGYVLLDPLHNGRTYLIDNNGQTINSWLSKYEPGRMAYLLPNGHLLRAAMMLSGLSTGGGEGGRLEEYDWAGNMVWSFDYASPTYSLHHDFKYLPNGNILALLVEVKTSAQMLAAGFRPDILQPGGDGSLQPDAVVEIQPVGTSGGVIVWEWHAWHHLIQNFDSSRSNYGTPSAHPELIDPNASYPRKIASFWNHMNGLDYNPDLDQIMLSVRGNSEVWVIDHSTTKAQSAGHTGGKYGKGGDLLYRWGNPVMYGAGKAADEILYQQHDTQWIEPGSPGPGHILVFNNGVGRPAGAYSSVDEFAPPLDSAGNYTLATGAAYGPTQLFWTYAGSGANQYYDGDISGAQRLPNGNTLITYGTHGLLVEVTSGGDIVWKYSNPVVLAGPLTQGQTPPVDVKNENMNAVFKVRKYAPGYLGLVGKDLTPHGLLELYSARSVNAASFLAGSAPAGSIVAMFADTALADSPSAAPSSTLPVKLGGTSVSVTDSAGVSRPASLYYVSPGQINFVMPDGCATGKDLRSRHCGTLRPWAVYSRQRRDRRHHRAPGQRHQ